MVFFVFFLLKQICWTGQVQWKTNPTTTFKLLTHFKYTAALLLLINNAERVEQIHYKQLYILETTSSSSAQHRIYRARARPPRPPRHPQWFFLSPVYWLTGAVVFRRQGPRAGSDSLMFTLGKLCWNCSPGTGGCDNSRCKSWFTHSVVNMLLPFPFWTRK